MRCTALQCICIEAAQVQARESQLHSRVAAAAVHDGLPPAAERPRVRRQRRRGPPALPWRVGLGCCGVDYSGALTRSCIDRVAAVLTTTVGHAVFNFAKPTLTFQVAEELCSHRLSSARPHAASTCNVQHICSVQAPTSSMQHATDNMQNTMCNIQHSTCNVQFENMQRVTYNVQHATSNMQHATGNVQHTQCPQRLKNGRLHSRSGTAHRSALVLLLL